MSKKKILVVIAIIATIILFKQFNLGQYLTFEYLKSNQALLSGYYQSNKAFTIGLFLIVYILSTAFSLPGATILTLAGGAIFGLGTGTVVVSFGSTIGATCAFFGSRYLFKSGIQEKFGQKLHGINEGIKRDGAFYLLSLRLVPAVPFFLINLLMGLTPIKTFTFYWVSQLGMLPGTIVYVNAGQQLSQIDGLQGILSPGLILSFTLLGIFPWIAKSVLQILKNKKVYQGHKRPKSFDYNMIAIGGGAAGLVTSYISAAVKAKVALIEREAMGGDCLNTGCVPSKAIIKSAKVVHLQKKASVFGLDEIAMKFQFEKIMQRVHRVIKKIEPHDSVERYTNLGVECIKGDAKIISPWEVEVNGKVLTTKNITIATGARPFVPPFKGLDQIDYVTSDTLWSLKNLPTKLLVVGGGPIGLEMAQSFQRLGSEVTVIEMAPRVMIKEDEDVSNCIQEHLQKEGVTILTQAKLDSFSRDGETNLAHYTKDDQAQTLEFDQALLAIGRKARTENMGLEQLGIELNQNGTVTVDEYMRTKFPNIFACGDVAGPYQLTHMASHQAWFCAVNGLFGRFKKFKVDYSVVPWATYTEPEVATVGLTELEAKSKNIAYEVTKYGLDDLDRAIAEDEDYGFIKVLTAPGKDHILGATIVGTRASTMIIEFIQAMKYNIGLNKILGTIHVYPSFGEGNKYLAGVWKQKNTNPGVFKWLEKFHRWQRS
jgi:dihydrolipoamide dehydrogenase